MQSATFTPKGKNPFKPGAGLPPPLLAGREEETAFFLDRLERVREHGSGDALVIYAPRGMGKTVLMRRLRDEFRKSGAHAVWATPMQGVVSAESLAELLPKGFNMGQVEVTAGTGPLTEMAYALKATWRSDKGREARFSSLLEDASQKTPRALFLDEAHTLGGEGMAELLNMMQEVMGESRFMLILIGTPGLPQSVRRGGTFAERFEYYSIDMLADEAAIEALQVPLEKGGIKVSRELLHEIALDAQRYPYFIQVWGEALWNYSAKHGVQALSGEQVRAVAAEVAEKRGDFYGRRFEEIRPQGGLFAATVALADAFQAAGLFDLQGVAEVISLALKEQVLEPAEREGKAETLLQELVQLGYIWKPIKTGFVQPGVPSLLGYVADNRIESLPRLSAADIERISRKSRERQERRRPRRA